MAKEILKCDWCGKKIIGKYFTLATYKEGRQGTFLERGLGYKPKQEVAAHYNFCCLKCKREYELGSNLPT
jgi:hypothetical protein